MRLAAYLPRFPASIYHGFVQNLPLRIWKTSHEDVVIDGTGLIGSKNVAILARKRHELIATSHRKGINSIIGEGLATAMTGGQAKLIEASGIPHTIVRASQFLEVCGIADSRAQWTTGSGCRTY
ncbi:hypothetical protein PTKU46_94430 [Paraburkholderia terrae]|uniref:hypothetical protein n=1 Tax=Paraburkholderia terrae TaxID=311230 RepID=UPI0030E0DA2E